MLKRFGWISMAAFALAAVVGTGAASDRDKDGDKDKDDDMGPNLACSVVAPNVTCVMTGLDNPRGLAFGRDGALFVAEAGRGGAIDKPCSTGGFNCYGLSGAVSRLWYGRQVRVASGLPSLSFTAGASARGPHDIAMWSGRADPYSLLGAGGALVTVGLEADPATRVGLGRPDLGKLFRVPDSTLFASSSHLCEQNCYAPLVDIAAFQPSPNPDPNKESDPYGLLVDRRGDRHGEDEGEEDHDGGHHDGEQHDGEHHHGDHQDDTLLVVDASRNWLDRIDASGQVSRVAVFPSRFQKRSTDSVPTSVVVGPDGDYYVGELVGIPFSGPTRPPSNIYRVAAAQPHAVTVFLTGFNAIIDMAFHDGDLYVLQHWTTSNVAMPPDGQLLRIACHGQPLVCDGAPATVIGGLDGPTSFTFSQHGNLYVTNHGASRAFVGTTYTPLGEVLRVDLGHGNDDDDHEGEDEP